MEKTFPRRVTQENFGRLSSEKQMLVLKRALNTIVEEKNQREHKLELELAESKQENILMGFFAKLAKADLLEFAKSFSDAMVPQVGAPEPQVQIQQRHQQVEEFRVRSLVQSLYWMVRHKSMTSIPRFFQRGLGDVENRRRLVCYFWKSQRTPVYQDHNHGFSCFYQG